MYLACTSSDGRCRDSAAGNGFTTTYKNAGTAKRRASRRRLLTLWVGLWVGKAAVATSALSQQRVGLNPDMMALGFADSFGGFADIVLHEPECLAQGHALGSSSGPELRILEQRHCHTTCSLRAGNAVTTVRKLTNYLRLSHAFLSDLSIASREKLRPKVTFLMNQRILVVDDEPQIRRVLRATLASNGYEVIEADNGEDAIKAVVRGRPDLILLDVNMPGMSGLETCGKIRLSFDGPIIMVTVRNSEQDKIRALDSGADDYVVKPFAIGELVARIRAALRRSSPAQALPKIELPGLTIDLEKRMAEVRGERVYFTPKEFDVLRLLVVQQGKPLTHKRLLQTVWGPDYGGETENLRVVIRQLRKKIEKDPAHPRYILTEPWTGYRFDIPTAPSEKH